MAFGGFSGEAEQRTITDSTGSATFGVNQSYQEVCVLYLDGRRVVLRPVPLGHFFCPCADYAGITFDVRL